MEQPRSKVTLLGRGASAAVVALDARRAAKMVTKTGIYCLGLETLNELCLLRACRGHPHILQVVGVGVAHSEEKDPWVVPLGTSLTLDDGTHLINRCRLTLILERCPLGDLENAQHSSFSFERRLSWIYQTAQALTFLHHRGILHRDVAPKNILLFEDNVVKLADFGLCRGFTEADRPYGGASHLDPRASDHLGSPIYAAPEVLFGTGNFSGKIDVWSLGIMAFELLSGQHPLEMQGVYDEAADNDDTMAISVLRSLYRLHPHRLPSSRLCDLFPYRGRTIDALHKFDDEPYRYSQWLDWFRSVQGAPVLVAPTDALENFFHVSLRWSPQQRASASDLLRHPLFSTLSLPKTSAATVPPAAWTPARSDDARWNGAFDPIRKFARVNADRVRLHNSVFVAAQLLERALASPFPGEPRELGMGCLLVAVMSKHTGSVNDETNRRIFQSAGFPVPPANLHAVIDHVLNRVLDYGRGFETLGPTLLDVACEHFPSARSNRPAVFAKLVALYLNIRTLGALEAAIKSADQGV